MGGPSATVACWGRLTSCGLLRVLSHWLGAVLGGVASVQMQWWLRGCSWAIRQLMLPWLRAKRCLFVATTFRQEKEQGLLDKALHGICFPLCLVLVLFHHLNKQREYSPAALTTSNQHQHFPVLSK